MCSWRSILTERSRPSFPSPKRPPYVPQRKSCCEIWRPFIPASWYPAAAATTCGENFMEFAFREIIGNHGIEPWHSSGELARAVKSWIPRLKQGLDNFDGVVLENKLFSVSVHFRHACNKKKALKAITEIARTLPGARLLGGKQVVNIVPEGAPDKGRAVERARQEMKCDKVIYVGDDKTDEDVFAVARRGRTLTIRVGPSRSSSAHFYIRDQREIDRLLKALIELRSDWLKR